MSDNDTQPGDGDAVTVTEEVISNELNEDARNQLVDETVDGSETSDTQADTADGEQKADADAGGDKPKRQPKIKARPDGTYELERADGTKLELSEDEIQGLAKKRVARATWQQREAERKAEDYRKRLEASGSQPSQTSQPADAADDDQQPPSWENGDWNSMDEYLQARDAWRDRQMGRAPSGQKAPQTSQADGSQSSSADPAPGFNAEWVQEAQRVMAEGAERFGDDWQTHVVNNDKAPFDVDLTNFVFSRVDDAAGMLVELGRNTQDAVSIRKMLLKGDQVGAALALGKISARIESGSAGTSTSSDDDGPHSDVIDGAQTDDDDEIGRRLELKRTRKTTQTPPPTTPVTSRAGVTVRKDPDSMTQREYEAWRAQGGT